MNNNIPLSDLINTQISGDWGKDLPDKKFSDEVSCVRGADINNVNLGIYDSLPLRYIENGKEFKYLKEGYLVIEVSGGSPTQSTGRVAYIRNVNKKIICSNFCRALEVKPNINSKYCYYLLKNIYDKNIFFNFESKTTGIKNLLFDVAFKSIKIKKNELKTQNQIAIILSSFDSKIELNNKINAELEAMAKTLYDYWFVQFDFPDENSRPYKNNGGKMVWDDVLKREIPTNWKSSKLGILGTFKNGINYTPSIKGDTDVKIINVRNISNSTWFISQSKLDTIKLPNKNIANYLITDDDILIARSGIPGATRLLYEYEKNTIYCGFIIRYLVYNSINKNYLFFCLKDFEQAMTSKSGGTIMQNVNQDTLNRFIIPVPPIDLIIKFNQCIRPIFKKINNNIKENQYLEEIRDWLLPMLMNGQVTVN